MSDLGDEADDAEDDRENQRRAAGDQPHRFAHGGEIGGDVDGVGDHQQTRPAGRAPGAAARLAMLRARPCRVFQPMQALMIWIAAMNGSVRNTVHSEAKPNCAPACE